MDTLNVPESADALPGHFKRLPGGSSHPLGKLHGEWESQPPWAKHVDLVALQTQTDQNRQKLVQMEETLGEVSRKLLDWTEVTRSDLDSVRSDIGAIKLEHRFSRSLSK